jgi:hypothetical protein
MTKQAPWWVMIAPSARSEPVAGVLVWATARDEALDKARHCFETLQTLQIAEPHFNASRVGLPVWHNNGRCHDPPAKPAKPIP